MSIGRLSGVGALWDYVPHVCGGGGGCAGGGVPLGAVPVLSRCGEGSFGGIQSSSIDVSVHPSIHLSIYLNRQIGSWLDGWIDTEIEEVSRRIYPRGFRNLEFCVISALGYAHIWGKR